MNTHPYTVRVEWGTKQALKRKWLKGYHSRHCRAISSYSVIKHWYPSFFLCSLALLHSLESESMPCRVPPFRLCVYEEMYRYANRKQQHEATASHTNNLHSSFFSVVQHYNTHLTISHILFSCFVCCASTTGPSAQYQIHFI